MPGKHNTVFPLRRYGFIGGAATLLVLLVSWVAVRSVGPAEADGRMPLMVQPTVPLAVGVAPTPVVSPTSFSLSPSPSRSPSLSPSPSPSLSRSASATASALASPSASRTTTKPAPRKTTPPAPAATFTGRYTLGASWDRGFIGAVTVRNKTGPSRSWTVRLAFPDDARVRLGNTWNADLTRDGDTYVLTGGPLAPGATVTLGFEASKQVRGRIAPTACTVDGTACDQG